MPLSSQMTMNDPPHAKVIPVWTRSFGSWHFSISRHPFAARELEGHYDKASDSWHTTIAKLGFETAYAGLVDHALQAITKLDHANPLKVLDAGIGTGAFAAAFASRYPDACDLTGVDVSSEMLRQAERHLQDCDLTAQLLQGDVNNLPFEDGTFDVILVAHVIEHMAAPEAVLAELCRVLKPGGVVIACVTQRSSAGAYIQLKWRTHSVDARTATYWFRRCGLTNVCTIQLPHGTTAQRFSNGYVACKPSQNISEDL